MASSDVSKTMLAEVVRQAISPVVMVISTEQVEQSCRKNYLSFADLLRPFCILENVNVPVRTASDQPYRLQEFQLRLFNSSEISQPHSKIAEDYLSHVVSDASDDALAQLEGDPQNLENVKKSKPEPNLPPLLILLRWHVAEKESHSSWFQKYSKEFMRTLLFSEHEAIDHPVACLLVVSSTDESPLKRAGDLIRPEFLPALFNEGAMDPNMLKHYVVVHDKQNGHLARADEILSEMKTSFGTSNCTLLCINSGTSDNCSEREDLWSAHLSSPINADPTEGKEACEDKRRGCFIDHSDIDGIVDFVLDLSLKQIIPFMEQKIRVLNQQVVATKKGLKNQIKNLWWRKGKEEIPDTSSGAMYAHNSIESQMRVLADYAFILRDYELAASNFRMLASDYKTDKAWKRYAGVQEMLGLVLFMMDQNRREAEACLEAAYVHYQKCGASCSRYATRAALWSAEVHKSRFQFKEAAAVYFRASTEESSLRAAVLLEQAAYCYLLNNPPMLHKYGFHLVLAGNRYTLCSQRNHAIRTYTSVTSVYGAGWDFVSDHVHFHLGRLSAHVGDFATSVHYFLKLLACSHQSASNQATFLREFLFVIQNLAGKPELLDLDLPAVNAEEFFVNFEDHRTFASTSAVSLPEEVWASLEERVIPASTAAVSTWLDAPKLTGKAIKDFNISIAGEEIGVDVEFSNPLQISIDVSATTLICNFTATTSSQSDASAGTASTETDVSTSEDRSSVTDQSKTEHVAENPDLILPEEAFSLKPGEKVKIRVRVKPCKRGMLSIIGVKWILSGIAPGFCNFVLAEARKASLKGKTKDPPAHQRLKFHVLEPVPRLEVSLHELPSSLKSGEVRRVVLELSNPSTVTLKNFKFRTSHPSYLLVGDHGDLEGEFPSCLEGQRQLKPTAGTTHAGDDNHALDSKGFIFCFPETTVLEGGCTLLWPLWIHARRVGSVFIKSVIYSETEKDVVGLRFRTVRMTHNLQVLPSLRLSVDISPCPLQLQRFLLRLDVENQHAAESFWLRQVSCAGRAWSLAPLLPPSVEHNSAGGDILKADGAGIRAAYLSASVSPSQLLQSGQTLSLFFQLVDSQGRGNHHQDTVKNQGTVDEITSDIRLGPPSSREPLIDISSGPLFQFHLRERLYQPKPKLPSFMDQVAPATKEKETGKSSASFQLTDAQMVDIVLISEQQEGMSAEKSAALQNNFHFSTHHLCHSSVQGPQSLAWVLEGPSHIVHDFLAEPFCEVAFLLTIRNISNFPAAVNVETFDANVFYPGSSVASPPDGSREKVSGWLLLTAGDPPASDVTSEPVRRLASCNPYMWCNLKSSVIPDLKAGTSAQVPLHVAMFAPGIFDLSRYRLVWNLKRQASEPARVEKPSSKTTVITRSMSTVGLAPDLPDIKSGAGSLGQEAEHVGVGHPSLLRIDQKVVLPTRS